jgi:hypothetical protein
MTEAEWLTCTDPTPMLEFLRGKASDRKLRLFAAACCRRVWHLLNADVSKPGVEVIERYSDGLATDSELDAVFQAAARYGRRAERKFGRRSPEADLAYRDSQQAYLVSYAAQRDVHLGMVLIYTTQCKLREVVGYKPYIDPKAHEEWHRLVEADGANLAVLLSEVIGNPFRPVTVDPRWLTSTAVALARAIYDERAFDRLPILADALEDAGCDNTDLLAHCRGDGPHVRGCWAVDLVLGKE